MLSDIGGIDSAQSYSGANFEQVLGEHDAGESHVQEQPAPLESSTERATGVTGEAQGQGGPHVHFSEPLNRPQQISGLELKGSNKLPRVGQNKSEMKNFESQSGSYERRCKTRPQNAA